MFEPLPGKKTLFVSEREELPLLFGYRKEHPSLDCTLLDEEGLLDVLSFSYRKDPVPFLLTLKGEDLGLEERKGQCLYDFDRAKGILKILRRANLLSAKENVPELYRLYELLKEKNYLSFDLFGARKIAAYGEIVLLDEKENAELHRLLLRAVPEARIREITPEDLGMKPQDPPRLLVFPDKMQQYFYLFSRIRKSLLAEGEEPGNISVLIKGEEDRLYLQLFSDLFQLPCRYSVPQSLLTDPAVKEYLSACFEKKSIPLPEDPALSEVKGLVSRYGLSLLPFDSAYPSLLELLTETKKETEEEKAGIDVRSSLSFDADLSPRRTNYVTDFTADVFYTVYGDTAPLPDAALEKLEVNPSYVRTQMDRVLKANYLRYQRTGFVSRVKRHLNDRLFPSPLLKEEKDGEGRSWESRQEIVDYLLAPETWIPDGYFPAPAKDVLTRFLSENGLSGESPALYDHRFQGIKNYLPPKAFGVTDFNSYASCPFQYYLSRILKLSRGDPEEDETFAWFGSFVHETLENVYDPDYDYEKAFEKAKQDFKASVLASDQPYTARMDVGIEVARPWLKKYVDYLRKMPGIEGAVAERPIALDYHAASGKTYHIVGRIDRILYTRSTAGNFFTLIDYKTGSTAFNPSEVFLGKSLQLPLYAAATDVSISAAFPSFAPSSSSLALSRGFSFAGFGIQRIFQNSPKDFFVRSKTTGTDSIQDSAARGLFTTNLAYREAVDPASVGKKKFQDGEYLALSEGETLAEENRYRSGDSARLFSEVDNALSDLLASMSEGRFPIAPLSEAKKGTLNDNSLPCAYCPYADVCYVKEEDIRSVGVEMALRKKKEKAEGKPKTAKKGKKA